MKKIIYIAVLIFQFITVNSYCGDTVAASDIYRVYMGSENGYKIYIVDGTYIRENIFGEFVYGGNPARYPFIPEGEIWIDNAIAASEYKYTLEHELNECSLMYQYNMNYYDAHDSSLTLEVYLRKDDGIRSAEHENSLPYVYPIDFDSTKEIAGLPDSLKLQNVYLYNTNIFDSLNIFIVDGGYIRKNIYPDFAFSGNSEAYKFIPDNEIWIDGSISCDEMKFSAILEYKEKNYILAGYEYDNAYTKALDETIKIRKQERHLIKMKTFLYIPDVKFRETVM